MTRNIIHKCIDNDGTKGKYFFTWWFFHIAMLYQIFLWDREYMYKIRLINWGKLNLKRHQRKKLANPRPKIINLFGLKSSEYFRSNISLPSTNAPLLSFVLQSVTQVTLLKLLWSAQRFLYQQLVRFLSYEKSISCFSKWRNMFSSWTWDWNNWYFYENVTNKSFAEIN